MCLLLYIAVSLKKQLVSPLQISPSLFLGSYPGIIRFCRASDGHGHFGSLTIPPASLSSFNVLSVVVFALIYEKIIVPIVYNFTSKEGGLSQLLNCPDRVGSLFFILALASAAIVETKRLQIARNKGLMHQNVAYQ